MKIKSILITLLFISIFSDVICQEQDTVWSKLLEVNHARVLKFSPDGRFIFAGIDNNIVKIETATGETVTTFPGHCYRLNKIEFSPTGDTIICSGGRQRSAISLFDYHTGDTINTIKFTDDGELGAKAYITPEGKRIITLTGLVGLEEPDIIVFDIETKEVLKSITIDGRILNLELSNDGKYFCVDNRPNGYIYLYDLSTYEKIDTIAYYLNVSNITFSPDGNLIAVCGLGGKVLIIDVKTRSVIRTLSFSDTPYENILQVVFSNDSKFIILGNLSEDYLHDFIQVWDFENETKVFEYPFPAEKAMNISHDNYIVTCGFVPYGGNFMYFLFPKWENTGVIDNKSEGFTYSVNNNFLMIEFEEVLPEAPTINIYDIAGKKIKTLTDFNFSNGFKTIEMDIDFLAPGVFLIEIICLDKTYSIKLLKE